MIRVTVEIVPHGVEERKRQLGVMEICNLGTGTKEEGNYKAKLHAEYTGPNGREEFVNSFRRHDQSVWSLVGALLKLWGHTKHSPKLMSSSRPPDPPKPKQDEPEITGLCYACGGLAKKRHEGKPVCVDCYNELAKGVVQNSNINFFGGRGGRMDEDGGPWQQNAVRDMEG